LERVAADVKEYERENVDTFEASVKAKHNLMTVEQNNGELECLMELFSAGLAV
jgi:serine/threonine-protein kinase PRP4